MTTTPPPRLDFVDSNSTRIAVYTWEPEAPPAASLILVHGTGFLAALWQTVASLLAQRFRVYAIDRRGHGRSDKPQDAYQFLDFADDLCAVLDHLGLDGVYGVGHSAGATDILLAAAQRPDSFARIFAMEPTIADPEDATGSAEPAPEKLGFIDAASRRRSSFASAEAVVERLSSRGVFATWQRESLELYATEGFEARADGQVHLRCSPETEVAMLRPILEAMEGCHRGDSRGNPFATLRDVNCPVRVSTTERSSAIYKDMARRAEKILPNSTRFHFDDAGHCVAQEDPAAVVDALLRFADETS